jgi:squalene-hopene/tetraprenyl-beta-curcumene cyclase
MKFLLTLGLSLALSAAALAQESKPAPAPTPAPKPASAPAQPQKDPDVQAMIDKAIAYLKAQQDPKTGGWGINPKGGPNFPAFTGLVLTGMLMDPATKESDSHIQDGVKFILANQQPDGGIYDQLLPSYNTSISLSALSRLKPTPQINDAIKKAQTFLKSIQFGEGAVEGVGGGDAALNVTKDHPSYGGFGYGKDGRPDLSNTGMVLEGLHDSGVPADDPAFQRALVFLQRLQMVETKDGMKINDMPYAKGTTNGGFIYAAGKSKDDPGNGDTEVKAGGGKAEETLSDGTVASRLRTYGSMSYTGFKSYAYAGLKKDDPRVKAALEWMSKNYTVTENPGIGPDGLYYYYLVFGRAMRAYGDPMFRVTAKDGSTTEHNWAKDLIAQLATLQNDDGSFKPLNDRWMEKNPVLITAYSLIALQSAREQLGK